MLQAKLTNLAIQIGYGGMAVSLVTVIILSVKFSVDEFYHEVSCHFKAIFAARFMIRSVATRGLALLATVTSLGLVN